MQLVMRDHRDMCHPRKLGRENWIRMRREGGEKIVRERKKEKWSVDVADDDVADVVDVVIVDVVADTTIPFLHHTPPEQINPIASSSLSSLLPRRLPIGSHLSQESLS